MSGITIDKVRQLNDGSAVTDDIIKIGDGTDVLAINADGSINVVGGSEYAEDTAHTTADLGQFMLAVRQDTKASTAGTDGDYAAMIQNATGELYVVDEAGNALLATIDADTSLLAGTVAGTELQVDIVASLPAGTNNIGDVDVLTMPGTQLEDAASAGGETLLMVGGYRQDAAGSPVSADGDFHGFIFNNNGELKTSTSLNLYASSVVVTTQTVDTTVGGINLVATGLTGRRTVTVQNLGNQDIWVKEATGVTAGSGGNGFLVPKDSSATYEWDETIDLYAITASGSSTVKIIEAA